MVLHAFSEGSDLKCDANYCAGTQIGFIPHHVYYLQSSSVFNRGRCYSQGRISVWSSTLGGVLVGLFASGPMARVGLLTVMLRLWVTGDTSLTKLAAHTSAYLSVLQMLIWLSMDYAKRLRT